MCNRLLLRSWEACWVCTNLLLRVLGGMLGVPLTVGREACWVCVPRTVGREACCAECVPFSLRYTTVV